MGTVLPVKARREMERSDIQSSSVPSNIVGEYYAPHARLARATLAHEQDLLLLRLLNLAPNVGGQLARGGLDIRHGRLCLLCLTSLSNVCP